MITKQKGTYDLYGKKSYEVLELENIFEDLIDKYNYEFIRTPLFEASELFHRGVGETTDIVTKETYDFLDRGDRKITLRPEGTAGVVRSYIENKMYADSSSPKKFWYYGPMYRYERPQSGRFREHYQFGCEVLGSFDPLVDAEIIAIPVNFFKTLGLEGIKVNINSLGDEASREAYKKALTDYLKPHIKDLCEDCQTRFKKNPLRILDCKVDKESEVLLKIPRTIDYLNEKSQERFNKVLKYLDALAIDYVVNPNTVRGLDYYSHTVFEIEADVEGFGSQNVMCGGGRYDFLVESLDGPSTPAMGFGMGSERLLTALEYEKIDIVGENYVDCYIVPVTEVEKEFAFTLTETLRMLNFKTELDYNSRTIKANFKQAERLNASFVIILGEEEIKNGYMTIKNMFTKQEEKIKNENVIKYLAENLQIMAKVDDCTCGDDCHCEEGCSCDDDCTCGCHDEEK